MHDEVRCFAADGSVPHRVDAHPGVAFPLIAEVCRERLRAFRFSAFFYDPKSWLVLGVAKEHDRIGQHGRRREGAIVCFIVVGAVSQGSWNRRGCLVPLVIYEWSCKQMLWSRSRGSCCITCYVFSVGYQMALISFLVLIAAC